jgi:hypothetical protein
LQHQVDFFFGYSRTGHPTFNHTNKIKINHGQHSHV